MTPESTDSAFARLRERQPSPAQRERLVQLRDKLALDDQDALWSLLELFEDYCSSLLALQQQHRGQGTTRLPTQGPWRLLMLGMSAQVLLLAVAMYVGARAATGGGTLPWSSCQPAAEPHALLTTILSAPAGWLAFALALPALAHGALLGWRLRADEPLVGWIIACTSTLTASAVIGLLLWLL